MFEMSKKRKTKKQKVRAAQRSQQMEKDTVSLSEIGIKNVKKSRKKISSKPKTTSPSSSHRVSEYQTERLSMNYPYILHDVKMSLVISGFVFTVFAVLTFVL